MDVIEVLKVFNEDLIAREKSFSSTLNTDLFTGSCLLAGTETFKKKNFLFLFCNESHKSQSCKIVTHIETRLYTLFYLSNWGQAPAIIVACISKILRAQSFLTVA